MLDKKLYTVQEAAKVLNVNPEVLRRWLRNGTIKGIKIGSDWRISEATLEEYLAKAQAVDFDPATNTPKMCIKCPKWLEFSGLPKFLNQNISPYAWCIFKKLVELDFENQNHSTTTKFTLDFEEFCERVGYDSQNVLEVLEKLAKENFITLDTRHHPPAWVKINTPVRTPISPLDIPFSKGGIKGAPDKACESQCLRRYIISSIES